MQVALCDQIRQKAFDLHGYRRSQQIRFVPFVLFVVNSHF